MKSTLDAAAFAAAVKTVSAILKKSKVPQLAQVRVQFADDACRVSATDTTAWLSAEIPADGDEFSLNVSEPFILPAAALKYLSLFKAYEGELLVGEDYAAIMADGLTLTCHLVERSDELQIETVLPKQYAETYQVSRRQYLDALRYLTDCTNTKEQICVVFDGGHVIAYDRHGKYAAKIQLTEGSSEVRYAFNLAYMKQAMEHFKDVEYVQINAISDFSPIILRGGDVTAMVLPLRMRETKRAKAA